MLKINLDTHKFSLRVAGHAGYAPSGQDIVCAAASMLTATLTRALGGVEGLRYIDDGESVQVSCKPSLRQAERVVNVFSTIDGGFNLLANSYPNHVEYIKV